MVEKEHRSTAKTVFVVMLIIELIIVLTIFMLTVVFSDADSTPSFMGHSFYISDIDKMDDAVKVGSMVVAKNGRPGGNIVGGVILCENIEGFGTGIFRVVGVEATSDNLIYKVCLDAAPTMIFDINATNVIGECKYSYYTLGKAVLFVKSKMGVAVCVVIPALLLAFIELILGFIKEMKKRELQRRRETVKKEQAKRYSTKRRRESSFSVDDFKNEDATLKRKHQKSHGNDDIRPQRAVRSLSRARRDDRTKLMEIPPSGRSTAEDLEAGAYSLDNDQPYENKAVAREPERARENREERYDRYSRHSDEIASDRESRSESQNAQYAESYVSEYNNIPQSAAPQKPIQEREPVLASAVSEVREDLDIRPAQTASVVTHAANETQAEQAVRKPLPKKPSLSLEEMMKLMQNNKEKLKKDIEKNKASDQ